MHILNFIKSTKQGFAIQPYQAAANQLWVLMFG